jgi:hypothetical protein
LPLIVVALNIAPFDWYEGGGRDTVDAFCRVVTPPIYVMLSIDERL